MTYDEALSEATKILAPIRLKEILEDSTETLKRDCKRCDGGGRISKRMRLDLVDCYPCGGTGDIKTERLNKARARVALLRALKESKVTS